MQPETVIDFTPDQVVLYSPPLVGTLGRAEVEFAAAVIVRVCQVRGTWGPVHPKEVGDTGKADVEAADPVPFATMWTQPIVRPDFDALIERGFARWVGGTAADRRGPIELTTEGLERLRQWVRR